MDRKIKKEWARRLRSGEYKQAKGALSIQFEDGDRAFCATGVLMEMAVEAGVIKPASHHKNTHYNTFYKHDDEDRPYATLYYPNKHGGHSGYTMPKEVAEWAGLNWTHGAWLPIEPVKDSLDDPDDFDYTRRKTWPVESINDHGATFEQIADLLDNHSVR